MIIFRNAKNVQKTIFALVGITKKQNAVKEQMEIFQNPKKDQIP
jgi:hypothetical protein